MNSRLEGDIVLVCIAAACVLAWWLVRSFAG